MTMRGSAAHVKSTDRDLYFVIWLHEQFDLRSTNISDALRCSRSQLCLAFERNLGPLTVDRHALNSLLIQTLLIPVPYNASLND